jgi:hypothetical protein
MKTPSWLASTVAFFGKAHRHSTWARVKDINDRLTFRPPDLPSRPRTTWP